MWLYFILKRLEVAEIEWDIHKAVVAKNMRKNTEI